MPNIACVLCRRPTVSIEFSVVLTTLNAFHVMIILKFSGKMVNSGDDHIKTAQG